MAIFPRTWTCVGDKVYQGVSADLGVLPTANVKAGTFAVCVDNGAVYGFSVKTSTWIEQPSNSKVLTSIGDIQTVLDNITGA